MTPIGEKNVYRLHCFLLHWSSNLEGAVGNAISLLSPVSLESEAKTPMLKITFPTSELEIPILTITFESDSPELCTAYTEDVEPPVAEQKDDAPSKFEGEVGNVVSSPSPGSIEPGSVSDALLSSGSLERVPVNVSVSVLATEHNDSNGELTKTDSYHHPLHRMRAIETYGTCNVCT
jgi:hypothetical protein